MLSETNNEPTLRILKDWGDLIAVYKPAGWLTIPGRKHGETAPPILSHVLTKWIEEQKRGRIYTVHRLDEGTSGVILFALTADAHKRMNQKFENAEVKKTYLAMVHTPMQELQILNDKKETLIHEPILKLPSKKNKSVVSPKGKPSQTLVKILAAQNPYSLVQATPLTGRSHQIRVHLAHIGLPLVGDTLYGSKEHSTPIRLFAQKIEFLWNDPHSNKETLHHAEAPQEDWVSSFFRTSQE